MDEPVTRYTTPEEKENIAGIDLDADDVQHVLDLVNKGLVGAAALHEAAVQENMALGANVIVSLTRGGIAAGDGSVEDLTGTEEITATIRARKIFLDPVQAPPSDS